MTTNEDSQAPARAEGGFAAAQKLASSGELRAARDAFVEVLRHDRGNVAAWMELAHVCHRLGARPRALQCYQSALALDPARWQARLACARILEESGDDDAAAVQYFLAVSALGNDAGRIADVHHRMGRIRLHAGRPGRSLECFRQAYAAAMQTPAGLRDERLARIAIDLGDALARLGMTDEAARAFEASLVAREEATLDQLARTAYRSNLWRQAIAALRRNVELRPESGDVRYKLVRMMADSGQVADAAAELERSAALMSEAEALNLKASLAARLGDTTQAFALYMDLIEKGNRQLASSAALNALYAENLTPKDVLALHKKLFAPLGEGARARSSFANDKHADRQIRIGLVTADLHRQHPVDILLQPVLKHLSRERMHTTLYFVGETHDEETRLAQSRVDAWRDMGGAGLADFRRQVDADRIDVMVDLAGHTGHNRMAFFAKRLAPVQATFLGYPGTTGVPNMDWIVADATVIPPEHDKLYSEAVLRLPNTVFCYAPEADYPFPAFGDEIRERPLTFGSFNNIPKITTSTVHLWSRVLKAAAGSRLVLKGPGFGDAAVVARYKGLFAAEDIGDDRLEFRGPVGLADMMAEYADIDIALDPFPYNGGATTLQAMWMSAPVVTRCGGSFVQRMGASFMGAAQLGDWVAADEDGYVAIAVAKAHDRTALLDLKRSMRKRLLACPAWDIERYTRDFEAGLRQMWRQWCRSGS